jgi:dsRNA-specific ribonuclease
MSAPFAVERKHLSTGSRMEDRSEWMKYRDQICYPVERYLLGFTVRDRERLISAIISNALLNEKTEFEQLKKIPADPGLETIGDFVLDFVIIDHFALMDRYTAREIDDFRQGYGGNDALHDYAKNCLRLQNFILWGPDERDRTIWDQPTTTILADRFEMLVAVIYLENGIGAVKEFLEKHHFFEEIDAMKTIART